MFGAAGAADADGVLGTAVNPSPVSSASPIPTAQRIGVRGGGGAVGVWGSGAGATATPPAGDAIGVFGAGGSGNSDGVYGIGHSNGYGGQFASGFAPLRLVPASAGTGHPTGAQHNVGEFYVDSHGSLFYCKASGTPGTWVKLA